MMRTITGGILLLGMLVLGMMYLPLEMPVAGVKDGVSIESLENLHDVIKSLERASEKPKIPEESVRIEFSSHAYRVPVTSVIDTIMNYCQAREKEIPFGNLKDLEGNQGFITELDTLCTLWTQTFDNKSRKIALETISRFCWLLYFDLEKAEAQGI